jgi:branched-chain amino acid transport system substrate-binding protein
MVLKKKISAVAISVFLLLPLQAFAADTIRLYLDADRTTKTLESTISIERGIQVALSEAGNRLGGKQVEIVALDHKGAAEESKKHLEQYLADENALAVYCGLHSPPVLKNRDFINEKGILLLDPWAAAGPITRYPSPKNSIFRLSVDDTKAGFVITAHALMRRGFRKPPLLLENTGWGKSNQRTMTRALANLNMPAPETTWFEWGVEPAEAAARLENIASSGADVIFFVGNAPEGITFVEAMLSLSEEKRKPIMSHWGITGGNFAEVIDASKRRLVDIEFIQTNFSFLKMESNPLGRQVFERAKTLFPDEIQFPKDIKAPVGFIHAYDLTRILIAAVEQAGLTGEIVTDRENVRLALENLEAAVQGLVKTYEKPFSAFDENRPDAHEALGIRDYTMASFGPFGEIVLKESIISR